MAELDGGRADLDALGGRGDLADQHRGRRTRDGDEVVLGEPVAAVAPPFGVLGQVDGVAQRRRGVTALADRREVEDRTAERSRLQLLHERDRVDVAFGGQRFGQPGVAGRPGRAPRPRAGGPRWSGRCAGSRARRSRPRARPAAPAPSPRRRCPLSVQMRLSSAVCVVEAAERAAGDGRAVEQPDQHAAVWRLELVGRIAAQPRADPSRRCRRSGWSTRRRVRPAAARPAVVLADGDEAQSVDGWQSHHSSHVYNVELARFRIPRGGHQLVRDRNPSTLRIKT